MIEIRFHGRGGQGVVMAAEILALAAFYEGKEAQAFPSFGVERRGAPILAFTRIADSPIRLREQIYDPDYIVVLDATLIGSEKTVEQGSAKARGVLINSEKIFAKQFKNKNVVSAPATAIAMKIIGKPFINTAMLGAFAAWSGLVSEESLAKAIEERLPAKVAELNVKAMREAFEIHTL